MDRSGVLPLLVPALDPSSEINDIIGSLKATMLGMFTPQKSTNTNRDFPFLSGKLVSKHLPAYHCQPLVNKTFDSTNTLVHFLLLLK